MAQMRPVRHFDFVIFGGGIFGAYTALYLQKKGYRCALIEQDQQLFGKASTVNQARLHSGYHYPRSFETAAQAYHHRARFVTEHVNFISGRFDQFYGIDRYQSWIDAIQYESFCNRAGLVAERHDQHPAFNFDRIEALYRADEWSFDPYLIAQYYIHALAEAGIVVQTGTQLVAAEKVNQSWRLNLQIQPAEYEAWETGAVVNATYASLNRIQQLFGITDFHLSYELCEMVIVDAPTLMQTGLTIMDGPFCSVMPFGLSGQASISSVIYTPHYTANGTLPSFPCQDLRLDCRPESLRICNQCEYAPPTHQRQMIAQLQQYLHTDIPLTYQFSLYTVKAKLLSTQLSDGRPTVVKKLHSEPNFYTVFGGKISSIYEIETEFSHV